MSNSKLIELNEYLKMLFNFSRCGDLTVIGLTILQHQDPSNATLNHPTNEIVSKSIEFLLRRHELLRAHIEHDESSKKVFFCIDASDPKRSECTIGQDLMCGHVSSYALIGRELERLIDQRMNYVGKCKLWRAAFFSFPSSEQSEKSSSSNSYALAFFLPLFMTDALNITSLAIELVNMINSILRGVECDEMRLVVPLVETEIDLVNREGLIGPQQLAKIDEIKKSIDKKFKFDAKFESASEFGSKISTFRVNKANSASLVAKCKKRGLKFSGFLMSAIFYSIRDLYVENGLEPARNILTIITVNMRFRLRQKIDFACPGYFSGLIPLQTEYPLFGRYEDIWSDSKYWNELIARGTDSSDGSLFFDIGDNDGHRAVNDLFEKLVVGNDFTILLNEFQANSKTDVFVSNIGPFLANSKQPDPNGPLEIKELYYADSLSARPSRDNSIIYHAGLWRDELMFMVTSDRARLASHYADRLVELLEQLLNRIALEPDNS